MVEFDLWRESAVFALIYAAIIIVPCVLVAILGCRMINQMGLYPTKTPVIQMGVFLKLAAIEIVTFGCLIGFYRFFES